MNTPIKNKKLLTPGLRISLLYLVAGVLWILFSDALLARWVGNPDNLTLWQTIKGLGFVAISAALVLHLATSRTTGNPDVPHMANPRLPLVVFCLLALFIMATGAYTYHKLSESIRSDAENRLSAVARLKSSQVESWLAERYGDAKVMGQESLLSAKIAELLAKPKHTPLLEREVRQQLGHYIAAYGYSSISLFDAHGKLLLTQGVQDCGEHIHIEAARQSVQAKATRLVDLHHECETGGPIEFGLMSPVIWHGRAVAALYLESDPESHLFPLIHSWPDASPTAESVLVRRDGDRVTFLNRLRHLQNAPLALSLPLDDPTLVAAIGLRGQHGVIRNGYDYRHVPVLAYATPIEDTPWLLISRMDETEAFAGLRRAALITTGISALLMLFGALLIWNWWRRQAIALAHQLQTQQLERQALVEHYDYLSKYANDIILLADTNGRHVEVNDRALEAYGYTREELLSMRGADLRAPEARASFDEMLKQQEQAISLRYETVHQRKDGSTFPVEVSARLVNIGDNTYRSLIIHDITERKATEARIRRMNNLYAALSQCNQAIVRARDEQELYDLVCRDAVEAGGMKMAWIGIADAETRMVRAVAWFGEGTEYLQDIQISTDADSPLGCGPTGTAVREGIPFWCQDFQNDPATTPWHARGQKFGWHASAAVPIFRGGKPIGAFTFYAGETGAFDEPARNLLEEMGIDISYALDRFDTERMRIRLQNEVVATKTRMEDILAGISQGVWSADARTHQVLYLSAAIETIYGRPVEDFYRDPMLWFDVIHAEDQNLATAMDQHLFAHGQASAEFRIVHADGTLRWVHDEARLVYDDAGNPLRIDGIVSDVTERKHAESQLLLSAKVFEQSAEGIIICDADNRIISVNHAFCEITGVQASAALGQNPNFLRSGRHDRDFYRAMWKEITENGRWQGEVWNRRDNGEIFPEWLSISTIRNADGKITHYIGIFNDITQHKQAEEHIRYLAHFDALTGLPNRTLLNDRIAHATSLAQRGKHPMALMFLDLDRFKNVNDSLGHQIGDQMLIEVAQRLKAAVREEDTVSRLGGDEFIILLPSSNADGAAHVAEKVIQSIAVPFEIGSHELTITPSIGIAMYPVDGHNAEMLIQCADSAMYQAKQSGRNMFRFFTPEMHLHASRSLQLENALRRALEREQLSLHYQPQLDLASGRLVGCEALLRWQHPEFGMISPADFVPIAEDSGQILSIGEWVMREAVRQIKHWQAAGLPLLPVAVNLSAVQFRQLNLPQLITQILRDADLAPEYLELELTERITMEQPNVAIEMLDRLHQSGVKLSIDDFGTGYSSLSYLKRFNIHKLKIDQSFVRDITEDPEDEAIVSAVISMAKSLNLRTIAEGVESEEQLQFLREKGCDEIQGYFFSKPLPPQQFEELLRAEIGKQA